MSAVHFPLFAKERRSRLRSLIGPDLQNWSLRSSLTDGQCLHACSVRGRSTVTDSTPSSAKSEKSGCNTDATNALYALAPDPPWRPGTWKIEKDKNLIWLDSQPDRHFTWPRQHSHRGETCELAVLLAVVSPLTCIRLISLINSLSKNALFRKLIVSSRIQSLLNP